MKYIKGFDTLRALAVFFVVVSHWGPDLDAHSVPGFLKNTFVLSGGFGVNLFFVLSGYLISSILLNEKMRTEENPRPLTSVKNFYVRRFLRIFPIYYLTILICYLVTPAPVKEFLGYYLTYTANTITAPDRFNSPLVHTWTLCVEEQFYFIWPWLILFVNKKYLKHVFISFIVIGITAKFIGGSSVWVFNFFDSFGIGALYAYIRLNEAQRTRFDAAFKILFPLLLFVGWRMTPYAGLKACVIYKINLESLMAIALIMFAINNQYEWVRKYILENRVFNYIGKISYGIYLYHLPWGIYYDGIINPYFQRHGLLPAVMTTFYFAYILKLAGLLIICAVSYKYIEQPILRLKRKFEYT